MIIGEEKRKVLEELPLALAVFRYCDGKAQPLLLSDGFCRLFGWENREEALREMEQNPHLSHPEDAGRVIGQTMRFVENGEPLEMMYRPCRKTGKMERMIHATGEQVTAEDGTKLFYVWYILGPPTEAPTEGVDHPAGAAQSVNAFQVTDLPDRSIFFPYAAMKSQGMLRAGKHIAFMFLDLNGLKYYNTRYGFQAGTRLLKAYGELLEKTFGKDNCCHLGGDNFTAFTEAEGLDEILKGMFEEAKKLNDGNSLPVHVGISVSQDLDFPMTEAIDRAKYSCDSLKSTYESVFAYYNETINDDLEHRHYILTHLDQAIEEGWIQVYYQPIVRAVSEDISEEEALARWIDPEKGFLSPDRFIPILEEGRIIYKMDLYVLEQILDKIKKQEEAGFYLVPQSLNVSRSDFDSCDMVEEVRRRVDAAGISHDMITIEVTESMIGNNFDFMKKQVDRFRELGFSVWLDDFGSGYSSINIMQSIKFDLVKFDMEIIRRMEDNISGKAVLAALMRMALAMDMDTVCEGVETRQQIDFLREVGCSKLQGFYFSEPNPFHAIMKMAEEGQHIRFENPSEADYYNTMGRINLYDLSVIAVEDENFVQNYFDMLPMAIVEIKENSVRFTRSNPSYRDFARRFFNFDMDKVVAPFPLTPEIEAEIGVLGIIRQCANNDKRTFIDEMMEDGTKVHAFIRKIADNPVNGGTAVLIAVLSMEDTDIVSSYENIARVLAPDFHNTYYVNLEDESFVEYSSSTGMENLAKEYRGKDFFDSLKQEAPNRIAEEDLEAFLKDFTKEKIVDALDQNGEYRLRYHRIDSGTPIPVELQVIRLYKEKNHILIKVRKL